MEKVSVILFLFFIIKTVSVQGQGSGTNGNLRLCVVEGRGSYKRTSKYCPVLDRENSGIECVIGTDRLDCLRRISKGKVDFGVFSPEDLVAAQWAHVDLLVTNEIRYRERPYERSVVAVVNKKILPDRPTTLRAILMNRTLCHPGTDVDDLRPFSSTLSGYLEFLVLPPACDPELSLAENRVKALSEFFGSSCKAGPWVVDKVRDAQLKHQYPSLCSACGSPTCSNSDRYWGDLGSLACLVEVGEVAWGELDDVKTYFGLKSTLGKTQYPSSENYVLLCRDGTSQAIAEASESCVWLHRPWPVVLAKRKAAVAVGKAVESINTGSITDSTWRGALAALLEIRQAQGTALDPPVPALDYLAKARGFREAYSQRGCNPPRHITFCTTSTIANNKCEWLSEAGSVYGVAPPLQCVMRSDESSCVEAIEKGDAHVMQAESDLMLKGIRDHNLTAILHEATPIVEKTRTVVAYVRPDSNIKSLSDLRGKRAHFPSYDGFAWHSVIRYISNKFNVQCKDVKAFFSEICAPGFEKTSNLTEQVKADLTKSCYEVNGKILEGEEHALRAVVEGKSDVAFVSMETYNKYTAKLLPYDWALEPLTLTPVCPEDNSQYCFISWSSVGHIFGLNNLPTMRHQEIVNVFTKLDQLFGKYHPFHTAMFSMYGPYNHNVDVLFHNGTKNLIPTSTLYTHPYDRIPLNYERSLSNSTVSCSVDDFKSYGAKVQPTFLVLIFFSLVVYFVR